VPKIIADAINRLMCAEMRFAAELSRGVIRLLDEAAGDMRGGDPVVYLAARHLLERVRRWDVGLIVTSSGSRCGLHKGEMDGPLAAPEKHSPLLALAKASGISNLPPSYGKTSLRIAKRAI